MFYGQLIYKQSSYSTTMYKMQQGKEGACCEQGISMTTINKHRPTSKNKHQGTEKPLPFKNIGGNDINYRAKTNILNENESNIFSTNEYSNIL